MKGFDTLIGDSSLSIELGLLEAVLPRTCGEAGQGTKEWFLDQMFSGISSQIHHLVVAAAPILKRDASVTSDVDDSLHTILKYTHQEQILAAPATQVTSPPATQVTSPPATQVTSPPADTASTTVSAPATATGTISLPPQSPADESTEERDGEENEESKSDDQIQAEDWVKRLTMEGTDDGDDDFKEHLKNLTRGTLSWMLWLLSASTGTFKLSPRASTEKKFLEWIKRPRNERPSSPDRYRKVEKPTGKYAKQQR